MDTTLELNKVITVKEIKEIKQSLTNKTTGFFDYVEFARAVLEFAEIKVSENGK